MVEENGCERIVSIFQDLVGTNAHCEVMTKQKKEEGRENEREKERGGRKRGK